MKKIILIVFLACVVCACTEELPVRQVLDVPVSRSFVTQGTQSISNPDLIDNWENIKEIKLNRTPNNVVTAPWVETGTLSNLSSDFRTDIKKENGWTMLFHTFEKEGKDAGQNYMCFYNYFTGVLKVFYYYEVNTIAGHTQWMLKYDGGTPLQILDYPAYFALPDDKPSVNTANTLYFSNESGINESSLTQGWNGFEYQVSRYSTSDQLTSSFSINAITDFYTKFDFIGTGSYATSGTITSVSTPQSRSEDSDKTSIATANNDKAANLVSSLQDLSNIGNDIKSIIKSVETTRATADLILAGVNTAFQRSSVTYGTTSDVRVQTLGAMTLSGTGVSQFTTNVSPITFSLRYVPSSNLVSTALNSDEPFRLGVWTLKKNPKVYINTIAPMEIERIDDGDPTCLEFYGTTTYPEVVRYDTPEVVFNPMIIPYISSYKVAVKCLDYRAENVYNTSYYNGLFLRTFPSSQMLIENMPFGLYKPITTKQSIHRITNINSKNIDSNTKYYFNWKTVPQDRTITHVTVTLNINYMGKQFTVTETRAYKPDIEVDPGSKINIYHNPPYYYVINSGLDGAANY